MKKGTISEVLKKAFWKLIWVYSKWLLLLALIVYSFSGIYKIEGDAIGVLTRFGQVVESRVPPGLHYKLPWPIDNVQMVPVKQVRTVEINDFSSNFRMTTGGTSYTFYRNTDIEPYCITGDNNIVAIRIVLKYTVADPVKYLYGLKQPELFMERCTADLIVNHLARLQIDEVLTFGKKQLEFDLQKALVTMLEDFKTGLHLSSLEIKEITPPDKVQEFFDKVINAEVEKKRTLNEAQGYYNRVVPSARSEADRIIQEAHAYKNEKILAAEGEVSRFLARYEAYQENPEAHRQKMYLEFIKNVYPTLGEIRAIDSKKNSKRLLIPFDK